MSRQNECMVIQGYFSGPQERLSGGPHAASPQRAQAVHRAPTYHELTVQAHQRSSGLLVQSSGNRNAFVVPPHLAAFGRRAGQRLPPPVQQKMESFFGADFSDVQVHSGPEASAIGALAFTQGSNIYFAPGQYNPNSHFGQALLAHELTHVVQQRAGRVRNPFGSGMAVVQDPMLEAEAERMGRQAATHVPVQAMMAFGVPWPHSWSGLVQAAKKKKVDKLQQSYDNARTLLSRYCPGLYESYGDLLTRGLQARVAAPQLIGHASKKTGAKGERARQKHNTAAFKNWIVKNFKTEYVLENDKIKKL